MITTEDISEQLFQWLLAQPKERLLGGLLEALQSAMHRNGNRMTHYIAEGFELELTERGWKLPPVPKPESISLKDTFHDWVLDNDTPVAEAAGMRLFIGFEDSYCCIYNTKDGSWVHDGNPLFDGIISMVPEFQQFVGSLVPEPAPDTPVSVPVQGSDPIHPVQLIVRPTLEHNELMCLASDHKVYRLHASGWQEVKAAFPGEEA